MPIRLLEIRGGDDFVFPYLLVAVSFDGFGAASKIFLSLGFLRLLPLIHLHLARKPERLCGKGESGIVERLAGRRLSAHMDQFLFVGGVDCVGFHGNHGSLAFLEALCGGHRAAFVPIKKEGRDGDEQQPKDNAFEGIKDAGEPGFRNNFGESISHRRCGVRGILGLLVGDCPTQRAVHVWGGMEGRPYHSAITVGPIG